MSKSGKKEEFKTVGEAIRELLNSYRLSNKFDEARVVEAWERLVGKPIARRTKKVFIRNGELFVLFDSPAMKQDFILHRAAILEVFKKEFGDSVVRDIKVL
ncbi:MAG: DUF721 domain-containing protein [Bacteroidia bacterium]|nr:DUF721 domain-containing protein [Bacteroidia bacterium]